MERPKKPQDYWPAEIWESPNPGAIVRGRREAKRAFYASEEVGRILEQTRPPQYTLSWLSRLAVLAAVIVATAGCFGVLISAGILVLFVLPFAWLFVKLTVASVSWLEGAGSSLGLVRSGRRENPEFRNWQAHTEEIVGEYLTPEEAKRFEAIMPHRSKEETPSS